MKLISNKSKYNSFLIKIKERIRESQYEALRSVNKELISLYWDIGKMIVEKQKEYDWGKSIVETLADDLQKEHPGIRGFSSGNLWRMRNFYVQYYSNEKLAPMVREISWVKNIIIMEKCKGKSSSGNYWFNPITGKKEKVQSVFRL
jgi:hypothetical protein